MNIFWNRMPLPHLIYSPLYSTYPIVHTIKPIYYQSLPPASTFPYTSHSVSSNPLHNPSPGQHVYGSPFFKHFNHIVNGKVWEG